MAGLTLPLGIDIGETRIRVVEASQTAVGRQVRAVAVREAPQGACSSGAIADPEYVSAMIEDALLELGTKERRCICAIGEPQGIIRPVEFPAMKRSERERAARYEAGRFINYAPEHAVVRVHGLHEGGWVLGIAHRGALDSRLRALRGAGLKPVSMDHEAFAFARAFHDFDAVIDMGFNRTALHVFGAAVPKTFLTFTGGADITRSIQRDLGVDERSAEKRKRILGTAGAGERARAVLVSDITALIQGARSSRRITRVALTGNAARLHGLQDDLSLAASATFEIPVSPVLRTGNFPTDVLRSGAADWTLGAALTLWSRAA